MEHYRAVEVASEPITHEHWRQVPNGTVFSVDPDFRLNIVPLSAEGITAAKDVDKGVAKDVETLSQPS
jgi:hypothetical protein